MSSASTYGFKYIDKVTYTLGDRLQFIWGVSHRAQEIFQLENAFTYLECKGSYSNTTCYHAENFCHD